MKIFGVTLLFLTVFCINAFADQQAERQKILEYTMLHSPTCEGLVIKVPETIINDDGQVNAEDGAIMQNQNVDQRAQIKNCFINVNNAIQAYNSTKSKISDSLAQDLGRAIAKFMAYISKVGQANFNPGITPVGGKRG